MIRLRPLTLGALIVALLLLVLYTAAFIAFPRAMGKDFLLDFDVFYLVSEMNAEGSLYRAYVPELFLERQASPLWPNSPKMYWSYPPPFNFVIAPLSLVAAPLSYALFMIATGAFAVLVLRRLSGEGFHTVAILFCPMALLIIKSGQNSFLTGGLVGLACLLAMQSSRWAGLPLGLMAIKPHLALGVGIWSLLTRRWGLAALSLGTVTAISGLATLAFGPGIWPASLGGIADTAEVLEGGGFAYYRMTSIYASARSLGIGHDMAMALHLAAAILALASLAWVVARGPAAGLVLGYAVVVSTLLSPYNYDYDLAMLAAAAGLLLPALARHAGAVEKGVLIGTVLLASYYGMIVTEFYDTILGEEAYLAHPPVSLVGPVMIIAACLLLRILQRARDAGEESLPEALDRVDRPGRGPRSGPARGEPSLQA
ncbi:glycosyltransferase family 87 protein [Wenxinia saemankumensis]|uniref:DUF2029 domain-containing protein n=1 Tax=Wenxinia saemankumensis TaxID=1447782 RepID=A0A1M6CDK2_9RHOB|nr:glycosyltransferase family 87 protein [Wenxinia saemankumensis]SHI59092.1 Protein of unknown function [Wenxinia saemankumensis]